MNDIRYAELRFLQTLVSGSEEQELFYDQNGERSKAIGLSPDMYADLAATLIEDLCVRFHKDSIQALVSRLRGEVSPNFPRGSDFHVYEWENPRVTLRSILRGHRSLERLQITYRGLRRIEELRELLKRDRILEPFGVLLSVQYLHKDLEDALQSFSDPAVSVLDADMDNFKRINTEFGYPAGDVVMKAYLEIVRDSFGTFGTAYRGVGDEIVGIVVAQEHKLTVKLAETISKQVEAMECEYKGTRLPKMTASIGVASTPPESRTLDIQIIAKDRSRRAKKQGKNCVIAH